MGSMTRATWWEQETGTPHKRPISCSQCTSANSKSTVEVKCHPTAGTVRFDHLRRVGWSLSGAWFLCPAHTLMEHLDISWKVCYLRSHDTD